MLASRNPVGNACTAHWSDRATGESNVAARRRPPVTAGSGERPSGRGATNTAACRRRRPARRPARHRFISGIPAPPVSHTWFRGSPRRPAGPPADPRIPNCRLEDREGLMPVRTSTSIPRIDHGQTFHRSPRRGVRSLRCSVRGWEPHLEPQSTGRGTRRGRRDLPAKTYIEALDRQIAEVSGKPRTPIKSLTRVRRR